MGRIFQIFRIYDAFFARKSNFFCNTLLDIQTLENETIL